MASLFWGSNFAVTKGYDMKDGMIFQFWMATGILIVGIGTLAFSDQDPISTHDFRPILAYDGAIGGAVWCLGNLLTVSIVNSIGLGLGLSIWGGWSLVVSFVIGVVGVSFLGLDPQVIDEAFGIPGVILAVASLVVFSFVKPSVKKDDDEDSDDLNRPLVEATNEPDDDGANKGPGGSRIKGLLMVRALDT